MESHHPPNPLYSAPPPFSPPLSAHRSSLDLPKPNLMDIDLVKSDYDRSTRAASVLSGMSIEDMEAAETLNSLHASMGHFAQQTPPPRLIQELEFNSPQTQQPVPTHVQTTTSFHSDQPEPLLRLVTSQYPLAGSLINGSLSAYKTTQSYIPGAEWTERNVGLPLAGTVARISGVEGGLRWVLQPRRDGRTPSSAARTPDVEKGLREASLTQPTRRSSELSYSETLPAYSAGDRSPPYSEQQVALQSRERQPPPGWRQQLVISTSGLGIAMSEESLRSLRFCLGWLRWANGRLGEAIHDIKSLLERWEEGHTPSDPAQAMSVANMIQSQDDRRQAAMTAKIAALKKDVLDTLKQVVTIVSKYAGGALPDNARNLVHRHLTSLPQRFSMANAMTRGEDAGSETTNSANRVMVLAQEGLDMMTQVSRVVNDTLTSAEGWCEKLGRSTGRESNASSSQLPLIGADQKMDGERHRSETLGFDQDVKMEM